MLLQTGSLSSPSPIHNALQPSAPQAHETCSEMVIQIFILEASLAPVFGAEPAERQDKPSTESETRASCQHWAGERINLPYGDNLISLVWQHKAKGGMHKAGCTGAAVTTNTARLICSTHSYFSRGSELSIILRWDYAWCLPSDLSFWAVTICISQSCLHPALNTCPTHHKN